MSSGGSAPSGVTQYQWNDQIAPFWQSTMQGAFDTTHFAGGQLRPFQQYGGQRIANLAPEQQAAMGAIMNYAEHPEGFLYGIGNANTQNVLNGDYLTGANADPYAAQSNAFMGTSPQFNSVLQNSNNEITRAYKNGTAADTTRLMNISGVLGGSAHQNAVSNNEQDLAKAIANNTANMQNEQYNRSAQLMENKLNRASGAFQNERGRQMTAAQLAQQDQGLTLQRLNAAMGVGDINRSYQQDLLNLGYQNFMDQQNYPLKQLDFMSGILSRAQGGMSPNSYTQSSGYTASPFSQLLGTGLMAYGLYH